MESSLYELPEGYDLDKEPQSRYRLGRNDGHGPLSSRAYVIGVLPDGDGGRIPIKHPSRCDHGTTICRGGYVEVDEDGKSCAEVWQYDYSILWSRTQGGRRLIRELGIEADKNQNPAHPANPYRKAVEEQDEARYASLAAERERDNKSTLEWLPKGE